MAFNAQEILDTVPTENTGPKALTPQGEYKNCTIGAISSHEPGQYDDEKVIAGSLRIQFHCPEKDKEDIDLCKFVKVRKDNFVSPNSTLGQLRTAVWPDPEVRNGKKHSDLEGESVTILVTHNPPISPGGNKYAGYNFSPTV